MPTVQNYPYSTCESKKVTLSAGTYKLETWGASGRDGYPKAGKGGYSTGELTLNKKTDVYIHVGGQGDSQQAAGCNGGGSASSSGSGGGGGATDIRLITDDLYYRIIVAGGGGGAGDNDNEEGGFGGGLNGGDGNNADGDTGKGASQDKETVGCASSGTCNTGTFGVGASGYSGAGGGWYGGSAPAQHDEGSGGGSGYVLTENSFKPSGYKLNDKIYFLKNAETIGGDKSFPSPTSSSNETGHNGNGYARITSLLPARTIFPSLFPTIKATMKATMVGIKPALNFTFACNNGPAIHDKKGMFNFVPQDVFKSTINPGRFHFYANGSRCGQSIFASSSIFRRSPMEIIMSDDVHIKLDNKNFIVAPASNSSENAYVSSKAKADFNVPMSDYDCEEVDRSSLLITYRPFVRFSCGGYDIEDTIEYMILALIMGNGKLF